jgi:filamentous hemagglutinin family protein
MMVTSGFRRRTLVVALAGIYGIGSQLAHANPTGAQVVNGQAALQTQGNKLTVTNTPGAIINWQSFSVGAGETTYFQQQNAASAVLNRVQAQNPSLKSQIDGTLGSNGRVFLINPNGIVFGAGSVVDTQGFVASTLNLNDADFKAGKLKFSSQATAAGIEAKGRISSGSGDVYLVAPHIGVDGNAVITSDGGNVVLAAGEMVEITGRNLNDITFAIQSRDNRVINLGTLSGGAVGVFAGTLIHSGVIRAQTLANEGGRLVLKAQGDLTLAAGSKTLAEGNASAGTISIESQTGNVTLAGTSLVSAASVTARGGDVSLQAGSGIVSIERDSAVSADGGSGGSIALRAAKLAQDGSIHADGRISLGGSISVQADSRVIQSGSAIVSAQGVVQGGNITVSVDANAAGSGYLFTSGTINASASSGNGGDVTVTGRELNFAAARVVATGDAGGGAGQDQRVPNATNVSANGASSFQASARLNGNGGSLVVWSDGITKFAGIAEARGGANSGNGGAIEISGKEETQLGSIPNASAPHGNSGTFLLDPKYIRIQTPTVVAGVSVELVDPNPGGGDLFGQNLYVLSNGNILVLKPTDDFAGPLSNSGAVYLFDGTTGSLISQLRGSTAGDQVGSNYTTLSSGKLAVFSPNWSNGAASSAGAITWLDIATGASGVVSAANSLVGSTTNDKVGNSGLSFLGGNRYYTATTAWNNSAGAITWIDAAAPAVGAISSANSFVGSVAGDRLGSGGVVTLPSGNYLIKSPFYNSSTSSGAAGAVTWSDSTGVTGTVGVETRGNSVFGAAQGDSVGSGGIVFLDSNNYYPYNYGNFVVVSPDANGGAGAVTFANQNSGFTGAGVVSTNNSLVGTAAGDHLGSAGVLPLYNPGDPAHSNYLIRSPSYGASAGAVTWASGIAAIRGNVGSEINGNSVFGNAPGDAVGAGGSGIRTLDNYNFVVLSPNATSSDGLVAGVGAVTFGDQSSGFAAPYAGGVSASNSLVGTTLNDHVGSGGVTNLSSGDYVV